MIGLDTNVLLRYLVRDDPDQFERARRLIETRLTSADPGWVGFVVAVELVWALSFHYGYTRAEVADVIERLLDTAEIAFEREFVIESALQLYRSNRVDFADALVILSARLNGCADTASFDRELVKAGLAMEP
jgi:predicted nucleic-acid-binding protein